MVTHSSILAWRIPWTEEPGRLQSIGLQLGTTEVTQHACNTWLPRWFSGKEVTCQCRSHRRFGFDPWVRKIPQSRKQQSTPVFLCFPCGSASKESSCNVGDLGSIPRLGRFPGEGTGSLLQYSGLGNLMDCVVHGVTKSRTRMGDFHSLQYSCLENPRERGAWRATVCGDEKSRIQLGD